MPIALRVTKSNLIWEDSFDEYPWLKEGEIPADVTSDLKTSQNELSIWVLSEDKSKLFRCLSAFAVERKHVDHIDYIVFDEEIITELNLKTNSTKGNSKDKEVNNLHKNIMELSSNKLELLAKKILSNCEGGRIDKKELAKNIKLSLENGWIDKNRINNEFLEEIYNLSGPN